MGPSGCSVQVGGVEWQDRVLVRSPGTLDGVCRELSPHALYRPSRLCSREAIRRTTRSASSSSSASGGPGACFLTFPAAYVAPPAAPPLLVVPPAPARGAALRRHRRRRRVSTLLRGRR